jgi:hypothetical protein
MATPRLLALLPCLAALLAAAPAEFTPTLGKRGKLLLEETFSGAAIPAGWSRNTGELGLDQGALRSREVAADNHAAAFRKALPLQDCIVQVDVKIGGPTTFHLGFDPAPGELKKKGHLFSVIVSPEQWTLTEHIDKADPASKNKVHARGKTSLPPDGWTTLTLELKGTEVVAHLSGHAPLRASAPDFKVKKPGLVFRVVGKGEHAAWFDNVRVWALE